MTTTIPEDIGPGAITREKRFRRVAFAVVGLVVLAAAVGWLGVTTTQAASEAGEYRMEVTYAGVARPGLATPFSIEVSTLDDSPLPPTITIRLDSSYLDIFDEHGMSPSPTSTYNDQESTWWTFEVPADQSSLVVELDARLEPSVQWRRDGSAALEIDATTVVEVSFSTWVIP